MGGLGNAQPTKVPQLHNAPLTVVEPAKFFKRLVHIEKIDGFAIGGALLIQRDTTPRFGSSWSNTAAFLS